MRILRAGTKKMDESNYDTEYEYAVTECHITSTIALTHCHSHTEKSPILATIESNVHIKQTYNE